MKKWIFILAFILILVIPGLIRARRAAGKVEEKDSGVPVVVTTAKVGDAVKIMSFSSQVQGIEQAQIFPDIPGRFLRYTVEDGSGLRKIKF